MEKSAKSMSPLPHLPKKVETFDVEENDSPIEQVRLTVPITDDPTQPCLTFRTWLLGIFSCCLLAFLNQFFSYRQNALSLSSVIMQILILPVGKFMAASLSKTPIVVPWTNWSFSLNPGPFNLKEHVLITIFASAGSNTPAALDVVTIMKAFYMREIHVFVALLLVFSTQMLGFGWAGIFRKFLVDSPYMWWPGNLVQVSLFRCSNLFLLNKSCLQISVHRFYEMAAVTLWKPLPSRKALHDDEKRPKGGLTRFQFFMIVLASSFSYYIVPSYFFPSISALSVVCWIWKDSVTAHQLGSGLHGLGIGSFGLDWSTIAGWLGSPLATPGFAIINSLVGYIFVVYVLIPLAYWNNLYESKKFPLYSPHLFDADGGLYDVNRVLNQTTFQFNRQAYDGYSKIHIGTFYLFAHGIGFATLAATLSHVVLFYGRSIWDQTKTSLENKYTDVHTRIMKKNYDVVPQWWFLSLLIVVFGLAMLAVEGFHRQLQLPFWGVLMAMGVALTFLMPIAVIIATTNQGTGIGIVNETIIGYLYPGRPLASVTFRIYASISMFSAIGFLSDFKLGHYMKIPPKSMFISQLVGTIIASFVQFGTAWWILTSVDHVCNPKKLPAGSPWTCPGDEVFYNSSVIWGVVGPKRMFGSRGLYPKMNYCFLFGLLAPFPIWILSRKYPEKKWIRLINAPVIIGAAQGMPPVRTVNFTCWFIVGIFFNIVVYRKYKTWWSRHNYILSGGLDAGIAFMAILSFITLQSKNINGPSWWGLTVDDHCPLATCPTAPGIVVKGCPTF